MPPSPPSSAVASSAPPAQYHPTFFQTYADRAEHEHNTPLATYLFHLIHLKRTNLCVSADVTTSAELLKLAEEVGDQICILKTHADIVSDFGDKTIRGLINISRRKKFVIFEDRKFGDIGNTVQQQYVGGPLSIVKWAPIINAHIFPGPAIITALAEAARKAIAKHNTSVSTDISASPAPSVAGGDGRDESSDEDNGAAAESEEENEGDNDDDANAASHSSDEVQEDYRMNRKHSVVSVSTTISMKSETICPRPSNRPGLSPQNSSNPTSPTSPITSTDFESELEELGPPPFYRSLLLLAQMSSADNLLTPSYTSTCVAHARSNRDFVLGFIAQQSLNSERDDNFLTMTPGVQLSAGGDALGQQYNTPRYVVGDMGSDVIIVGRGVLNAVDRRRAALEYRRQGWNAYEERIRGGRRAEFR